MCHRIYKPGDMPIEGHENIGTIEINYFFPNGFKNGIKYSGTSR